MFASTPKITPPTSLKRSTYHCISINKKIPICLCFDILIFCFTHFILHPYNKKTRIIVEIIALFLTIFPHMCTLSKQKRHGIYVISHVTFPAYFLRPVLPVHPFFRLPVHHRSPSHVYPRNGSHVTLYFYLPSPQQQKNAIEKNSYMLDYSLSYSSHPSSHSYLSS